ncbi:uncharacterized protein E0L32_008215 [Thyridium curvatum]|uniref:Uncharacterized protein n=1 Tax=Thyridium curvatum TaxID=1093900 RepID=A0A507AVS4_9PEZI|nr:uncharacterized protein E0L32_008215 [Thyridium curvatum]TPX10826.1 hypothetical protein E0L32_008215 [Thyridium curvatum]
MHVVHDDVRCGPWQFKPYLHCSPLGNTFRLLPGWPEARLAESKRQQQRILASSFSSPAAGLPSNDPSPWRERSLTFFLRRGLRPIQHTVITTNLIGTTTLSPDRSGCPTVLDLAHSFQTLSRNLERFVDHALRYSKTLRAASAARRRRLAIRLLAIDLGCAVGRRRRLAATAARHGVLPYVVHNALEKGGEVGALAGAQEGQGVVLDGGGPVGRVGVEGVEQVLLDPGFLGGRRLV